jgi:hypothetical protein
MTARADLDSVTKRKIPDHDGNQTPVTPLDFTDCSPRFHKDKAYLKLTVSISRLEIMTHVHRALT